MTKKKKEKAPESVEKRQKLAEQVVGAVKTLEKKGVEPSTMRIMDELARVRGFGEEDLRAWRRLSGYYGAVLKLLKRLEESGIVQRETLYVNKRRVMVWRVRGDSNGASG